ncbi:MAG: AAA family ATPase, partial [Clostridia bacterium]|nr:AAA family ATPase [Clostridia bacterium]
MLNFERIELLGFKSFADKVKIDLLDGITAIVGPNGCGKSNVADAIKWVLGEQSAKTLRGTSMQDVIFNGTQSRKSLSYCEVSLYFNNTEKIFPSLEYNEVVMTRKLYRSGESEYFMNRQPCRLKDIVDALHECGVSKDGYTIIGQGKVSEILSSKPEDRRAIFEEAVGIAKTKRDRKETINKLSRTNDNIMRVSDILTERERQLEPLSRQAEKTRAHRVLAEELKMHEINEYLYKFDNSSEVKQKITDRINGLTESINERRRELEETIRVYNEHQSAIASADETIKILNEKITERAVDIEKQTGAAKVYAEKISFFRSEIERLSSENKKSLEKTEELKKTLDFKKEYGKKCNKEIEELTNKAKIINESISKLTEEINRGEDFDQEVQGKVLKSAESLADIKQNLGALSSEENVISERQKGVVVKVNMLCDKYDKLSFDNKNAQAELKNNEELLLSLTEQIKDKSVDVSSTNEFIAKIDGKIYQTKNLLTGKETGLRFYSGLKESFNGYNNSVKKLLTDAKTNSNLSTKIKGVVASVISTDEKCETAIQTAIGGAMQNVITANTDDTEYLINYLKRTEGGRITFLPITTVKPRYNGSELISASKESG